MKRLSIADIKTSEILSKEEKKNVIGGLGEEAEVLSLEGGGKSEGKCVVCVKDSEGYGEYSCWYTKSTADNLCTRVYGNKVYTAFDVDCSGPYQCKMN